MVFHDPIAIAKMVAERLRPRVDILIVLSHLGYPLEVELAKAVPELDVIVGGHSHTELKVAEEVNGVILVQADEYANNLGFCTWMCRMAESWTTKGS